MGKYFSVSLFITTTRAVLAKDLFAEFDPDKGSKAQWPANM